MEVKSLADEIVKTIKASVQQEMRSLSESGYQAPRLKYLTKKEASHLLKVHENTIDNYVKRGVLKKNNIGRRVLFSEEDVLSALTGSYMTAGNKV